MEDILNYTSLFTIGSFICFAIILILKKTNHFKANCFLALLFVLFAFGQFHLLLFNSKLIYKYTFLLNLEVFVVTLYSILFYFFVLQITGKEVRLSKKTLIIVSPIIIPVINYIWFLSVYNSPEKIKEYLDLAFISSPINISILGAFVAIINLLYLVFSYIRVKKYSIEIKDYISSVHDINLKWLQQIIVFFIIIFIVVPSFLIVAQNQILNSIVGQATMSLFYFYIFFRTFRQSVIFSDLEFVKDTLPNLSEQNNIKYAKSKISYEEARKYSEVLKKIIEENHLYLNSNFTIKDLAKMSGLNIHMVSQVINKEFNVNFFEFINTYRIDYAKNILLSPDYKNHSIESIGYDSGFGTKSSFFSVFKKFTSQTPHEFRKNNS